MYTEWNQGAENRASRPMAGQIRRNPPEGRLLLEAAFRKCGDRGRARPLSPSQQAARMSPAVELSRPSSAGLHSPVPSDPGEPMQEWPAWVHEIKHDGYRMIADGEAVICGTDGKSDFDKLHSGALPTTAESMFVVHAHE